MIRHECAFCGNAFWSIRPDAKYDTATCRQRALRWRKKMFATRQRLQRHATELAEYLDYPNARSAAAEYMHATIRQIEAELVMHGILEVK